MTAAPERTADPCVCDPDGPCLGVPGESDACGACLALDPEAPCLHDPEVDLEPVTAIRPPVVTREAEHLRGCPMIEDPTRLTECNCWPWTDQP